MVLQRSAAALARGPVTLAYKRHIKMGKLKLDREQLSLASRLDSLHTSLVSNDQYLPLIPDDHLDASAKYYGGSSKKASLLSFLSSSSSLGEGLTNVTAVAAQSLLQKSTVPKGIYIHGSVGVGKSMLMDLFYSICADGLSEQKDDPQYYPIQRKRRRCHFHEFMLDVHQRIHSYKSKHPRADPIPPVAASLAKEARLLCFDEMQITDIADAMIVKRLFTILLDLGVVIVTTSNRPPEALYEGGINRSIFLPFIGTLKERMDVIEMGSTHDYRRERAAATMQEDDSDLILPSYVWPSNCNSSLGALEEWFKRGTGNMREEKIPVAMGRSVHVSRANDTCGWFDFKELCHQPLGAADYLSIADRFSVVIVGNVPQLGANTYNEARRFVTLIDALYEARVKLVISADVHQDDLFVGFEAKVETCDGDEEIAIEDTESKGENKIKEKAIQSPVTGSEESLVIGEGGSSSSSSTTMIRTKDGDMEWSATGRIGVSLAQLSAVREVSFSFQRAESRLAEMSASEWGLRAKVE